MSDNNTPLEGLDDEIARMGQIVRSVATENVVFEQPPADLWQRIENAVAERDELEVPTPSRGALGPRGRLIPRLIATAAAFTLLGAGVAGLVRRGQDDEQVVREVALSNNGLDPRGVHSAGSAKLVRLDGGAYAINLDLRGLPKPAAGYFELWAIDTQVKGMVSLGPLHGGGIYRLPTGINPRSFPIVDISIEPADGIPTHSGTSVLRGRLL
ncbi:MAG: anti-sigma factor [Actinobacteria bacterium]|nr:anti-sigma factor [Actinomycetota bacterium]